MSKRGGRGPRPAAGGGRPVEWDADWPLGGDLTAGTKVALVRSFSSDQAGRTATAPAGNNATAATGADLAGSGEFSGGPAYQALVELKRKVDGRLWVLGASAQYLRESFNASVAQPAGALNHAVDGLMGSAHEPGAGRPVPVLRTGTARKDDERS